jgi:hypothetical protein
MYKYLTILSFSMALGGCVGGGGGGETPIDTSTRLSFEELLSLADAVVSVEEGLPVDETFGDAIDTTVDDVVVLGSVDYNGVGSYEESDRSGDFEVVYLAVGQFTASVNFTDGAASGEMFHFYEVSNLEDYNVFLSSDDEDATFNPENGGGIEGQLEWVATIGGNEFDDRIGVVEQDDGTRLTQITGTLTRSDGTFANIDAPIFTNFYGTNAEVIDGVNDLVGYNADGEEVFVDYNVGFIGSSLP